MLDFVSRDFGQYAWNLRTLDRRLHYFQFCQGDRNVTVDEVEAAVKKKLGGPGKLLVEQPRAVLFNPRVRKGLRTDSCGTSPTD